MSNTNQQIVLNTLKQHIAGYVRIDNQMREINSKLSELKKQKDTFEDIILETMCPEISFLKYKILKTNVVNNIEYTCGLFCDII